MTSTERDERNRAGEAEERDVNDADYGTGADRSANESGEGGVSAKSRRYLQTRRRPRQAMAREIRERRTNVPSACAVGISNARAQLMMNTAGERSRSVTERSGE